MSKRGQGRSHLARGTEAPSVLAADRSRVADLSRAERVDLAAVAREVSRVLRGELCPADCDDEVQATVISSWLSGRGLPRDPRVAHVELRRYTVRRVMSDLRGDRAGAAAKRRARAWSEDSWIRTRGTSDPALRDLVLDVPAVYGSPAQQQARCDARVVAGTVVATQPTASRQGPVLALVAGVLDSVEAGEAMGVSDARARQIRDDVVRKVRHTLRAWIAGAYDFS